MPDKIDRMEIEILPNGSLKVSTDLISGPNHQSAEAFLRELAEEMGGEVTRVRKAHHSRHSHEHTEIDQ